MVFNYYNMGVLLRKTTQDNIIPHSFLLCQSDDIIFNGSNNSFPTKKPRLLLILATSPYWTHNSRKFYKQVIRQMRYKTVRSSRPEVFLGKGVLKIFSKLTGEHPWQSAISINLQSNFIEIILQLGCSPVNLLHIFRTSFLEDTSGSLLLS